MGMGIYSNYNSMWEKKTHLKNVLIVLIFYISCCWMERKNTPVLRVLSVSVSWLTLIWEIQSVLCKELIFRISYSTLGPPKMVAVCWCRGNLWDLVTVKGGLWIGCFVHW